MANQEMVALVLNGMRRRHNNMDTATMVKVFLCVLLYPIDKK